MHHRYSLGKENKFLISHSEDNHNPKEPEKIEKTKEEVIQDTDSSEIITPSETKTETPRENQNLQSNPVSNLSQPEFKPLPGLGELILILIIITPFLLFLIKSKLYR